MPRRMMTIRYDGTSYSGWQYQPNAVSVQETVTKAIEKVTGKSDGFVTGCSRTDAGVHANMFCLHFDTESTVPDSRMPFAVNTHLPETIAALSCKTVDDGFHARYSCKAKQYIYKIYSSKLRDPFLDKYALRFDGEIDQKMLDAACKCFLGTHDFSGFCSTGSSVKSTVRTVYECDFERDGDMFVFKITADGFLYNMVRIIVGTLLFVALGKISADSLPDIISSRDRNRAGPTAPPHGLYLNRVYYDDMGDDING